MLLFAKALQNPKQKPIQDAVVWIQDDTVRWAGPRSELPVEARKDPNQVELPDQVLFPGLINAHAHLELTSLGGLPYPGSFVSWIRAVLKAKHNLTEGQQKKSMQEGIRQALQGGTTTIGDHISVTGDIEALVQSPLRGKAFLEVLGVVPEVARDISTAARLLGHANSKFASRWELIPSPHSVHGLDPEILAELLQENFTVFSMHLGESEPEDIYFREQRGSMDDFIAERGARLRHQEKSAIQDLASRGLLSERILAIHANYLDETDLELLRKHGISIVHCPLSHRYFSHRHFPVRRCMEVRLNLALGTDSLSSAVSLSMLDVLRTAELSLGINREILFEMATLGGAKALKMETQVGEIVPGKKADLIGISAPQHGGWIDALFDAEAVRFSMIGGKPVGASHDSPPGTDFANGKPSTSAMGDS